jgi:tRNA pseudouridine38-40 synthase
MRRTPADETSVAMCVLKMTLAYDGSRYSGWQVQNGPRTLQGTLEAALADVTGESIRVVASGRTDAGVHAYGQVVGFATESPLAIDVLKRAINASLPEDIAVLEISTAADDFHAIRDARSKRYRYVIHDAGVRDVFARKYCWRQAKKFDVAAMSRAAAALVGTHDFCSFQSTGAPRESTIRTVTELTVTRPDGMNQGMIVVEIEADGFLYNMVRVIVGTLVEVGRGAKTEQWPEQVLAGQQRSLAGPTAPPQGLFLVAVDYGD